jgi:demethoxyubiquinone hydroxylase (CLK1/Coq7/Cat5 family)
VLIEQLKYGIYIVDNVKSILYKIFSLVLFFKGIQTLLVGSKCHDLVITDAAGTIISGHYDRKIRMWDPFTDKCRNELKYDSMITSLSYNAGIEKLF